MWTKGLIFFHLFLIHLPGQTLWLLTCLGKLFPLIVEAFQRHDKDGDGVLSKAVPRSAVGLVDRKATSGLRSRALNFLPQEANIFFSLFVSERHGVWCQFMGGNTISLASYSHDWVGKAGLCRRRSGPGNSIHRWFREGTRNLRHVSLPLVTSCDNSVDQSCHFLPFGLEKKWKIWRCAGGCANLVVPKVQGAFWVICWINFGCMSQHAAFGGRDGQQGLRGFWLQWRWLFAASRGDDFMGNSWERRTFVYGR